MSTGDNRPRKWWPNSEKIAKEMIKHLGGPRQLSKDWNYSVLKFKITGAVATIKLNDPATSNGLTAQMMDAMLDCFMELHQSPGVKVVVFTAAGAYFCSGGAFGGPPGEPPQHTIPATEFGPEFPVGGLPPLPMDDPDFTQRMLDNSQYGGFSFACTIYLLNTLPQFKLAATKGQTIGAGNAILAAMDYVIAPDSTAGALQPNFYFKEAIMALAACQSWQGMICKAGVPAIRQYNLVSDTFDAEVGERLLGLIDEYCGAPEGQSGPLAIYEACQARANSKAFEVASMKWDEIRAIKKTGEFGTKRRLHKWPSYALDYQGIKGREVIDLPSVIQETLDKCGRKGRPKGLRFSNQGWKHHNVRFEKKENICMVTLKKFSPCNQIDQGMLDALMDVAIEIHKSPGKVRMLIVRAEGDYFCSGIDESLYNDPQAVVQIEQMLYLWYMMPCYVLGVIDSKVKGFGVGFVNTFDTVTLNTSTASYDFAGVKEEFGGNYAIYRMGEPTYEKLTKEDAVLNAEQIMNHKMAGVKCSNAAQVDEYIERQCDKLSKCAPNACVESKIYQETVASSDEGFNLQMFICLHIAKRQSDPEFAEASFTQMDPTYKPLFTKLAPTTAPHLQAEKEEENLHPWRGQALQWSDPFYGTENLKKQAEAMGMDIMAAKQMMGIPDSMFDLGDRK